jgi:hypothetical protein
MSGSVAVALMATPALWGQAVAQAAPKGVARTQHGTTSQPKVDRALGNGLGRLLAQSGGAAARRAASGFHIDQDALAIKDARGRVLVDVTPRAHVDRAAFRRQLVQQGLVVRAVDEKSGTVEGFLSMGTVRAVAGLPGLGTIAQALRPHTDVGDATSQGVALQRVDRVQRAGVDGRGVTIAALSDSYDAAVLDPKGEPQTIHAEQDVQSGDLPGPANPRNRQPVVVLEDLPADDANTDEGRAMLQIAHDVAPGSKLCFATAFTGLVGFADNVRALADRSGPCGADVVVDDVSYFDEPMFSDSVLSDAIDEVAAKGTHYFSAVGNEGEDQAWQSPVRLLPQATGVAGTNLDFSAVDPALYDGGLQDMDPGPGTDVAQTVTLGEQGGLLDLQWDDPVDLDGATLSQPIFAASGEITEAQPAPTFSFTPTPEQVGSLVQFRTDAIPSGTTDLILSVRAPDGTNLGTIDTGSSPEVLSTRLRQAGTYTITVSGFGGDTGDFTVDVRQVIAPSRVSTDFNVLFFDPDGHFLGVSADDNPLSGRPSEVVPIAGVPQVQMVVARAGTGPVGATRLRSVLSYDAAFAEYDDPLAPGTFGHSTADGATSVAAYDPFPPFLPEPYTSPGGRLPVYFDSAGNRFPSPQVRRVPELASADGGNTTFFYADSPMDPDTQPNFFGTSAAAPHAAAIAALALEKSGGPRSVRPAAMRQRLQQSTYTHDLDPMHAGGSAAGLTASADGSQGREIKLVPGSMTDPRFFSLRYQGRVPLRSVTFYGETGSPTAAGPGGSARSGGIVFDPRPFDGASPFDNDGFPFTVGSTSGGLQVADVSASFAKPAGSSPGTYQHLTVSFRRGLSRGQAVRFGIDRDLLVSAYGTTREGNGADELGGATFLPQRVVARDGMRFTAERADGRVVSGVFRNRLGKGFSPVDGYGVVDAERAVLGR